MILCDVSVKSDVFTSYKVLLKISQLCDGKFMKYLMFCRIHKISRSRPLTVHCDETVLCIKHNTLQNRTLAAESTCRSHAGSRHWWRNDVQCKPTRSTGTAPVSPHCKTAVCRHPPQSRCKCWRKMWPWLLTLGSVHAMGCQVCCW